jgi:hypothetical protein
MVNAHARAGITSTPRLIPLCPLRVRRLFDELSVTPLHYLRGGDTRTSFDTLCRNRQLPTVSILRVVKQPTRANTLLLRGGVGGTEPQMLDVVDRLVEQLRDVVVVEAVDDVSSVPVAGH